MMERARMPGCLTTIDVGTNLDRATSERLRQHVETAMHGGGSVLLDVRQVEYVNFSGFGSLCNSMLKAADTGGRPGLVGPVSHPVDRFLDLTGLRRRIPVRTFS